MRLSLKNIGKIQTADIEINGITVIAGENDTGKSTVGKVLYSVFNSFYKIDTQIEKERSDSIFNVLAYQDFNFEFSSDLLSKREAIKDFAESIKSFAKDKNKITKEIDSLLRLDQKGSNLADHESKVDDLVKRVSRILNITDEEIFKTVLSKKLDTEFDGQINNIYTGEPGEISLKIRGSNIEAVIENDKVKHLSNKNPLLTQAVYLDDPFILDDSILYMLLTKGSLYQNHREHLVELLSTSRVDSNIIEQIITDNKLESVFSHINVICKGDLVKTKISGFAYRKSGTDKTLKIRNLSSGLKTFVILKTLLQNGSLEENGTIILDEPEIHLHPEWQLVYAELIVLIQKVFNMHILLTTHSPYFLHAIEVYAAKHKIADICKYYLAVCENDIAKISDVSTKIESIYEKLSRPLQDLENERYSDD